MYFSVILLCHFALCSSWLCCVFTHATLCPVTICTPCYCITFVVRQKALWKWKKKNDKGLSRSDSVLLYFTWICKMVKKKKKSSFSVVKDWKWGKNKKVVEFMDVSFKLFDLLWKRHADTVIQTRQLSNKKTNQLIHSSHHSDSVILVCQYSSVWADVARTTSLFHHVITSHFLLAEISLKWNIRTTLGLSFILYLTVIKIHINSIWISKCTLYLILLNSWL